MRSRKRDRLIVERHLEAAAVDTLAGDVRSGLGARPKRLPPKHFYDALGSQLYEAICRTPEYYPARTERALLAEHAAAIVAHVQPQVLIELGSGTSSKTRLLLDELARRRAAVTYVPLDIDATTLESSARGLLQDYPRLLVRAVVADFDQPLPRLPQGPAVLAMFLGGTVGNLEEEAADRFLARLARALGPGGWLLLGTDMVKDHGRLNAAYNDARGLTARFNLNVLSVINRRLGAAFDLEAFEHRAFYDPARARIEMHLRSRREQRIAIPALEMSVAFARGETLRTEISRKFTPATGRALLERAGFEPLRRFAPPTEDFSLWLAQVRATAPGANPLASAPQGL